PKYNVILKEDRIIKLGFVYHPIILAWLGYEDTVKEYINAHINEWTKRGFKNNMVLYDVRRNIKPIWVYDVGFHYNHKAALYIKEVKRNETEWYQNMNDFVRAGEYYLSLPQINKKSTSDFNFYIWPFSNDNNKYNFS